MSTTNLSLYTILFASVDGQLLAEEQQIDARFTANAQRVMTVAKGFAGLSPGAAMTEVTITNAVPQGDFEFDALEKIAGLIPVDVQVEGPGGKVMTGKAFIEHASLRHGVNQETSYSFECVMPMSLFT